MVFSADILRKWKFNLSFRRMSAETTMCSPLPSEQRFSEREGYTWWSTHGFAADILQKWRKKKTMCRPPCVALPFWNLWSEERRLHMDFFFVHFRRMSAGKTMSSPLPSDQRFQKRGLHMVVYTWFCCRHPSKMEEKKDHV